MALLLGLALAGDVYDRGFAAGVVAAEAEPSTKEALWLGVASGACGGTACCVAGPFGAPVALGVAGIAPVVLAVSDASPELLPDEEEEYVLGYVDGYSKTRRRQRVKSASIGAAGAVVGMGVLGTGLGLLAGAVLF